MKISETGLALIRQYEGCRLVAYPDPGTGGDPWTIGYGSTTDVAPGMRISQVQADERLREDVKHAEGCINSAVTVPLTQGEFDALCSFVFNVGCGAFRKSTLFRKLLDSDYVGAAAEFGKWTKAGGRELPGLIARRHAEAERFEDTA